MDILSSAEVSLRLRYNQPAADQSCPHDDSTRVRISGSGIRDMLRHGFLPPKEIARPESGRIAIQGVEPKGLIPEGESVTPAGKIIASMFPFYLTHKSIGGRKRETPLDPDTLTPDDLYA